MPELRRRHPADRNTPKPGPIRKILTHPGEPLEPPPVSPAHGPPTDWGELVQIHDDRDVFQALPDEQPAIDIHSALSGARHDPRVSGNRELGRWLRRREKNAIEAGTGRFEKPAPDARATGPLLPRLTSRSSAGRPLRRCH